MHLSLFICTQVMYAILASSLLLLNPSSLLLCLGLSQLSLHYYNYIFCQYRDYTNPYLPVAPSAIDGSGQVRLLELTPAAII